MTKIKVVHLIPRDGIGGVESAARSMFESHSEKVEFILLLISGHSLINDQKIKTSFFNSPNNPFAHISAFWKIYQMKPDILVCSLWRSMFVGILTKIIIPDTKVVCFLHLASNVHFLDRMNDLMLKICDAVWADSETTLIARAGAKNVKIQRIISFVLNKNKVGSKNKLAPNFVFWGRLHYQKGLDRAVNFIEQLIFKGIDAHFAIWGPDDGIRQELQSLIYKKNLDKNIQLMGPAKPEKLQEIAYNNAFYLQLSRIEGMAISVVEAMQLGLVPVVTPVGEISKYCQNEINSVIVYDLDNPDGAINSLINILNDETHYRHLQFVARQYWLEAPLYAEDIFCAVHELYQTKNHRSI